MSSILSRAGAVGVLLALLASVSPAQDPPDRGTALLSELMGRAPAQNGYSVDPTTMLHDALWGDLAPADPQGPHETVDTFVSAYGEILGVPRGARPRGLMAVLSDREGPGGRTLTLAPAQDGVPYLKGAVVFQLDPGGRLVWVHGRYRPLTDAVRASIDARQAVDLALATARRTSPHAAMTGDGTVKEFFDDAPGGRIEHRFAVDLVVGRPPRQRRWLLGPSGEVLEDTPATLSATGSGTVFGDYPTQVTAPRDLEELFPAIPLLHPSWTIDGKAFRSESSFFTEARSKDGQFHYPPTFDVKLWFITIRKLPNPLFLETNVYYQLQTAREKAIAWGARETDAHVVRFDVWQPPVEGRGYTSNNAFYNPSDHSLHFDSSNPSFGGRHPAMDHSVIWHEYGHYLQAAINPEHRTGSGPEASEAGAVGEGFADAFAAAVSGDPRLAVIWSGGRTIRNAENSYRYPRDARRGGHDAGQLFSGTFWDLRNRIGNESATRIMVAGMRAARPPVGFRSAALGMVGADLALNGGGHLVALVDVLAKRGLLERNKPPRSPGSAPPSSSSGRDG